MLLTKIKNRVLIANRNGLRYFRWKLRNNDSKSNLISNHVYFDIDDPRLERYLYWLLKMFDIAGWRVSLKASPNLLLNLRNSSEYIYDIESLDIRLARPKYCDLVISNRRMAGAIFLDTNYFRSDKPQNSFNLPFFMFPDVYHLQMDKNLGGLRRETATIRVFVGGNLGSDYDRPEMRLKFGIANRYEIKRELLSAFEGSQILTRIARQDSVDRLMTTSDSSDVVMLEKNSLNLSDWLRLLAKSDFFIAVPGTIMPFCHNIIEAMAVGCIPITQYGKYFDPPLIDGETCLDFNDISDLLEVTQFAAGMDATDIGRMRENVLRYYDEHLDARAAVRQIYALRASLEQIYLIAGHLSVEGMS